MNSKIYFSTVMAVCLLLIYVSAYPFGPSASGRRTGGSGRGMSGSAMGAAALGFGDDDGMGAMYMCRFMPAMWRRLCMMQAMNDDYFEN